MNAEMWKELKQSYMFKPPVLVFSFFKPKIKTLSERMKPYKNYSSAACLLEVKDLILPFVFKMWHKAAIPKLFWYRIPQKPPKYTTAKCHAGVEGETATSIFSLPPKTINKKPRLSHHINTVIKARCYMLFPLQQMHALKCNFWQIAMWTSQESAFKTLTRTPCLQTAGSAHWALITAVAAGLSFLLILSVLKIYITLKLQRPKPM